MLFCTQDNTLVHRWLWSFVSVLDSPLVYRFWASADKKKLCDEIASYALRQVKLIRWHLVLAFTNFPLKVIA